MPPTDPRFLAMTPEDVEAEYLAIQYAEKGIPDEIEDVHFDEHLEELESDLGVLTPSPHDDEDFEEVINDHRT